MKKQLKPFAALLIAAAAAAGVQAQTQPQAAVMAERGPGYAAAAEAVQLQGKVKSVDKKNRFIVVVGANKVELGFSVGEEVRNFDQIKVGDLLTLMARQAIALELKKVENSGIRERVETEKVTTAKPGEKPAVAVEKSVRIVANVVAINPKAQTVTLQGAKRTLELYVQDAAALKNVKVGDQVEGTYSEAVVIGFTPAETKKK